jgi:sucrose-6-phosphate hydrolase SacC (GH32 family)
MESLVTKPKVISNATLTDANEQLSRLSADVIDCSMAFAPKGDLEFNIRGIKIKYDHQRQELQPLTILNPHHKGKKCPAVSMDGELKLRFIVDRASIEIFVNDGEAVATYLQLTAPKMTTISMNGDPKNSFQSIQLNSLKYIWK